MSSRFNIKNLKDLKNNRSKEFKSRLEKIKQGKFGDSDDEEDAESNLSSSIESQHKVEAYTKSLMGNQEYSVSDVDIDDIEGKIIYYKLYSYRSKRKRNYFAC